MSTSAGTGSPASLIAEARGGSSDALSALYLEHGAALFRLAYRLVRTREDAEDVVHDVFVGLPEPLLRYEEHGSFAAWLKRVTARVALMKLRRGKRRREVALDNAARQAEPLATAERDGLQAAVDTLPDHLRAVLVLKEIEGYGHAEVALLLGISEGASRKTTSKTSQRVCPSCRRTRWRRKRDRTAVRATSLSEACAGRAQAGTWRYRTCTVFDDVLTNCRGRLTTTVSDATWDGRPAWLMSQQQTSVRYGSLDTADAIRFPLDTAYIDPATLRPMYHAINGKQFHFVRRVTRDTVREALDIGGAHRRSWRSSVGIPGAQDAPLVFRWARVDLTLLLQVLPLDRWWSGSVYSVGVVGPDPSKTAFVPVDLRVVGSGRIEVPAGRFECWKLELRESPESMLILWVSKDRGWLVKTEQQGWDWRAESALVSATPPTP